MATFVKRTRHGKTVYQARVTMTHGKASATFDKLTDAKRWASETEGKLRKGVYFEEEKARKHTLQDAVDAYLKSPGFDRLVGQTDRKAHMRWWVAGYGTLTLARFRSDKIAEGRDKLTAEGKAPATVNRYLASLSACLTRTVRELGWLQINPCARVDRLPEENERERVLSPEDERRLLGACRAPALRDLVLLALRTAGRRGELLGLTWSDVDLKRGTVTFRDTKNGTHRSVARVGDALETLKTRSKVRHLRSPWIFPSAKDPKHPAQFRGAFENAVKRADLEGIVFHHLRHTALTRLAESGATLSELQQIAGHKTLAMVARYKHLTEDSTRGALERMAARFGGAR